jgi:hypothetical protein
MQQFLKFIAWHLLLCTAQHVSAGRPDHDQQHCCHHATTVKPEAATAIVELLMMGVETPETCWAVHRSKRQVMNLRNCCICLVDLFETIIIFNTYISTTVTMFTRKGLNVRLKVYCLSCFLFLSLHLQFPIFLINLLFLYDFSSFSHYLSLLTNLCCYSFLLPVTITHV